MAVQRLIPAIAVYFAAAQAQDYTYTPPIAPKSIMKSVDDGPNCNASIDFSEFVGKKVVFNPKTAQFRPHGYLSYHVDLAHSPSYEALAGQIATIESIGPKDEIGFQKVRIKIDKTGQIITSNALQETLSDVTLLEDITVARAKWVGKTLWYRHTLARPNQEVSIIDGKKILKFQPVKVLNVVAGSDTPLDFVVEASDGTPFLVGIRFSASNFGTDSIKTFADLHRRVCNFDDEFYVADPRTIYKWPSTIWSAIEREEVRVGMTTEQAIMAWGRPDKINETETHGSYSAQWVYGERRYLYFDGKDIVVAIQQ